jgi:hypothetical protein
MLFGLYCAGSLFGSYGLKGRTEPSTTIHGKIVNFVRCIWDGLLDYGKVEWYRTLRA